VAIIANKPCKTNKLTVFFTLPIFRKYFTGKKFDSDCFDFYFFFFRENIGVIVEESICLDNFGYESDVCQKRKTLTSCDCPISTTKASR